MPRQPSAYNLALKEFNKDKNFTFVRKGSAEYDEVKKIQERIMKEREAPAPEPEPVVEPQVKPKKTK